MYRTIGHVQFIVPGSAMNNEATASGFRRRIYTGPLHFARELWRVARAYRSVLALSSKAGIPAALRERCSSDTLGVVRQIIAELSRTLENLAGAARTMHADASDEQNKAEDKYIYEILTYTGNWASASCNSKVGFQKFFRCYDYLPDCRK